MGIPYSKQINAAFDQVTPLVAAGFEVLQTTKNISILLAAIQVLTVILLTFILIVLFAVLICINPGLDKERDALVTPVVKGMANFVIWVVGFGKVAGWMVGVVVLGCVVGSLGGLWYTSRASAIDPGTEGAGGVDEPGGEDIEAIKKDESKQ